MGARIRRVGYEWHLRQRMAEQGMFATTDLQPLLAERGVQLSSTQVYRLVTGVPERLNMQVLAALCDILECTPADLIEPVLLARTAKKTVVENGPAAPAVRPRPTRARVARDDDG